MRWRDVLPGDMFAIRGSIPGDSEEGKTYVVLEVKAGGGSTRMVRVLTEAGEVREWHGTEGSEYYKDELLGRRGAICNSLH